MKKVVVTGSEGFVGQHVVNKLLTLGHEVVGIDCFDPQVHGGAISRREYRLIAVHAGIVNADNFESDVVIHLGAKVGVGQSMYEISKYVGDNSYDTAKMLEKLTQAKPQRLVVASSMSIYGEGATAPKHLRMEGEEQVIDLRYPQPTREDHPTNLTSIYALTKYDQEQLCLIWGNAYNVPTVALRFFNIYGPGQSLSNPYTGVMAIFASRLLNNQPPIIYEDGEQSRDFVHVDDVANAVVHAATSDMPSGPYNVGTGVATSIKRVAEMMTIQMNGNFYPTITGICRKGDIRHCYADISKIKATGWEPKIPFAEGIMEYCAWLQTQPKPEDKFDQAHGELVEHELVK